MYYKQYYTRIYRRIFPRWIPTRVVICLMMFTTCWTSYMCRLQMPILAVPMIKALPGNASGGACAAPDRVRRAITWLDPGAYLEDYILQEKLEEAQGDVDYHSSNIRLPRETRPSDAPIQLATGLPFDWQPQIRGQLIAAYSYGNVPGNLMGGILALRWGPKKAILWTSLVAAVVCLFTPIFAQIHWGLLIFMRVVVGVTGGITFPACHTLVAKWAPPDEKARFVWSLLGGTFGTILTYPLVAVIAEKINWESGWYIPSLLMLVWLLFFAVLAYDSPSEHPGISDEEKQYILSSQAGTVAGKKISLAQTPIKAILTSVPFLSLICCHFGNIFLVFFFQNAMMLYLANALGFQLTKGGLAASLPWAGRMFFGFIFSWAGDTLKRNQIVSITVLRKGATVFSHFIPGIFLILVGYVGCHLLLANVFLVLALGFNGAASISNLSNNQDLSPNYAGFLYGIMNTIGSTSGMIISPLVEEIAGKHGTVAVVTTRGYYSSLYRLNSYSTRSTYKSQPFMTRLLHMLHVHLIIQRSVTVIVLIAWNPIERWQILFWIGAAVCIVCMVVFLVGGSGNIQPWNEVRETDRVEEGGN